MGMFLNSKSPYESYKRIRQNPYFVDKSLLLAELMPSFGSADCYCCITRPRRFGKTIMANMIAAFLGKTDRNDEIFRDLAVSGRKGCSAHLHKHNVISIDFSRAPSGCKSYMQYISRIESGITQDLLEAYPNCTINQHDSVWDILQKIHEWTDDRFLFVLDEWDAVFHMPFVSEAEQKEFLLFLKWLFKDQPYVEFVYMTGVLPIAKYSSGSELNMFVEYDMATSEKFCEYFGFSDAETDFLYDAYLQRTALPKFSRDDLRIWYDGYYTATGIRLYNPRSVVLALVDNQLRNYWTSSGPYDELFYYIRNNIEDVRDDLILMVSGERIAADIGQYNAVSMEINTKNQIYSAMVVYGLLTYENGKVLVPNKELMDKFNELLMSRESLGYVYRLAKKEKTKIMPMENTYSVPYLYETLTAKAPGLPQPLTVSVPGSKSITNRALLLATLARGTSTLRGVLFSDDSRHFLKCVQDLGFETTVDEEARTVTVKGAGGEVPLSEASQYVGSAGTAARFLTAFLGLSQGVYHMDASEQMRRRPMAPLLDSLKELGCEILYDGKGAEVRIPGTHLSKGETPLSSPTEKKPLKSFPFTLRGHGFRKNSICVNIDESSQFLSALLIVSCLCSQDFTTAIEGTHGMAYIEMTRKMMGQFGVETLKQDERTFLTPAGQHYQALDYRVEPDVSAACYFYASCPLLGIPVRVDNVHFDSLQGDVRFLRILEQMGCRAADTPQGILLEPPADGIFHGVTADMSTCSDQAITLAAIAPFADSPVTITGIGHIRFQESDRIRAIVTELSRMGIRCDEGQSSITIYPGSPGPCLVETYDDHRMAMGFSLVGLRSPGILIHDPGCCRKTFEDYFETLDCVAEWAYSL